jgi:hypothetical protein
MNCYNENFVNNFDSAFVIVCTIVLWWHIDLSPVKITLLRMALGGPAQVQSHEKKSRLFYSPQKSAVRSPIFLLARPPSLLGGLAVLLLLPPVRPPCQE